MSGLCDHRDAYIFFKGTITVTDITAQRQPNNCANKQVTFKNCALFTNCISRITNTQVDDTHDNDEVIPMNDLTEYSDSYSKTSGIL